MNPYRWLVVAALVVAAVLFGAAGILAGVSPAGAAVVMVLGGLFMVIGVNAAERHGAWLEREKHKGGAARSGVEERKSL